MFLAKSAFRLPEFESVPNGRPLSLSFNIEKIYDLFLITRYMFLLLLPSFTLCICVLRGALSGRWQTITPPFLLFSPARLMSDALWLSYEWMIRPTAAWHLAGICLMVPRQWRRDGLSLPVRGKQNEQGQFFLFFFFFSTSTVISHSPATPPVSLSLSLYPCLWSAGIMDHFIHKGEGEQQSEVRQEWKRWRGTYRIKRGKRRGGGEHIKITVGSARLFHMKEYQVSPP